jgi:hypothetical protein
MSLLNRYSIGFSVVMRTKQLLWKISLCIPICESHINLILKNPLNKLKINKVIKLLSILMTVFYFYSILGMEIFNTKTNPYREDSPYADGSYVTYTNFNSFGGGLLMLIQICTESGLKNNCVSIKIIIQFVNLNIL